VRQLDAAGIEPADIAIRRPTLDDAFMKLTGRVAEDTDTTEPAGRRTGKGRKTRTEQVG
jgi:ABC-2 type transport system ATP-binding protein